MPLTPQEMRALYPIARRYAYLDHAAIAPLATPVRSTIEVFLGRLTEEPFDLAHWERFRSQVRGRIAELLAVGPESIAFIKNTTSGLGLVAVGLDWEAGDNIVGVDREFPANIYPWMGLKRKGVELRLYRAQQGRIDVKALVRLCDQRTRVLAISAVQFWSGFRTDLAALSTVLKGRDILLVVDAIQAAGALRLDLRATPVDFLCAGAQKWLLGPIGVGFAYVGPRMLERLTPVTIGTDSVVRDEEYFEYDLTLKPDARRFSARLAPLLQQRRGSRSPARGAAAVTFWQKIKRELGRETQPVDTVVRLIILERAIRGSLVFILGIALLTRSRSVVTLVRQWVAELDVNPERRLIPRILITVLRPIGEFSTRTVLLIGIGALLFGLLELTEAVGLARRRRWAEYLTVIAGCIGIPLEVSEVLNRQTPVRIIILVINVAIVIYLAWQKHLFGLRGGVATETERS